MSMQYGFKPKESKCLESQSCDDCCSIKTGDCLSQYSDKDFDAVYSQSSCWSGESCKFQAQQTNEGCSGFYTESIFTFAQYSCLKGEDITDFHRNTTVIAPVVAIHFDASDVTNYPVAKEEYKTWNCQVAIKGSTTPYVDVIVVKEGHSPSTAGTCSTVGWISSTEESLSCDAAFQYRTSILSAPFRVSVRVHSDSRLPAGWAVVRSRDGRALSVTCGISDQTTTTSTSTSSSTRIPTSTSLPRTSPLYTEGSPSTTSAVKSTTQHPSAVTSLSVSTSAASSEQMTSASAYMDEKSQEEYIHKGVTVAGWVLAAVLAVLLLVLGALFLRRQGGCRGIKQRHMTGETTSSLHALSTDKHTDVTSLYVIQDAADASPNTASAATYENATSHDTSPTDVYVNTASDQSGSSSVAPRPESEHEYSSLDWSRDQANTYSSLGEA